MMCMENVSNSWVNMQKGEIVFQPGETPLVSNWVSLPYQLKKPFFQKSVLEPAGLIFYSIIYAIITYSIYQNDPSVGDRVFNALFFPLWPMLLVMYKSPDNYLRAVLYAFVTLMLTASAYQTGEITVEGNVFLKFLIMLDRVTNAGIRQELNADPSEALYLSLTLFMVFVVFGFILLIIHAIYIKTFGKKYVEMIITTKSVYLRRPSKTTKFDLVKLAIVILFSPFNITLYSSIYRQIKHQLNRRIEGEQYEFAKISVESVNSIKKKYDARGKRVCYGILLLLLGLIFLQFGIGIIPLIIGIILIFRKKSTLVGIQIKYKRSKVEGSLLMLTNDSILNLMNVEPGIAAHFPEVK